MNVKKINFSQKKAQDFNFLTRLYQYYTMYILFLPIFATLFYNFKINRNKNIDKKNYKSFYQIVYKRFVDIVVSFFALIILSPLFVILAIAIVLDDKGPVFYKSKSSYNYFYKIIYI